jgi:hypothetical protein
LVQELGEHHDRASIFEGSLESAKDRFLAWRPGREREQGALSYRHAIKAELKERVHDNETALAMLSDLVARFEHVPGLSDHPTSDTIPTWVDLAREIGSWGLSSEFETRYPDLTEESDRRVDDYERRADSASS